MVSADTIQSYFFVVCNQHFLCVVLISAYIHIPFCEKQCNYCSFPRVAGKQHLHSAYCNALKKEICETTAQLPYDSLRSIYIGGGTPSCIKAEMIADVLGTLTQRVPLATHAEITIEANPHSLSEEWIDTMMRAGINRISLGVQTLHDKELQYLGRLHSAYNADNAIALLRTKPLALSIDLMCGIPAQTLESWASTLDKVIADRQPEHLSVYTLSIEPGTTFAQWYSSKSYSHIWPDEEATLKMYRYAVDTLESAGYSQYEISNFCLSDCYSRHNMAYWNPQNHYIGFGAAAHSLCLLQPQKNVRRFRVIKNVHTYIERIQKNENYRVFERIRSKNDITAERIFLGLRRCKGVKLTKNERSRFADVIATHIADNLLVENSDGYISLTRRGIELANIVMSDFTA